MDIGGNIMNIKGRISIDSLKEGYIITDDRNGEEYARETVEGVITIIKKLLIIEIPNILEVTTPEVLPVKSVVKTPIVLPVKINISREDIFIPWFECDITQRKKIKGYTNIGYVETTDGKVMIDYKKTHYYTTKEKILHIPFPIPSGYFKDMKLSSVARTCIRAYRGYLEEKKPDENGTCDDVTYEQCINKDKNQCKFCIKESRFEDKHQETIKPIKEMTINIGV